MPLFKGIAYYDDRLFVMYSCQGIVEIGADGAITTTIYHEDPRADSHWCLVTYKNHTNYPIYSIKHFETKDETINYIRRIEPETPLISMGGQSPKQPLSYNEYLSWKKENDLEDFDYKKTYTPCGSNPREVIFQTKEQFLKANPDWLRI